MLNLTIARLRLSCAAYLQILLQVAILLLVSETGAMATVIHRIDIRGASRTGADAVRANLTIVPERNFSDSDMDASVKQLYATGYFSDVSISVSGTTLVVVVEESQLVNQVVFNGNRKIKDDKLQTLVQTKPGSRYNEAQVEADVEAIKRAYAATGRSDAVVGTKIVPMDGGHVNIAFTINEGERTKITAIDFAGNQAFSSSRLASVINTKKSNFLSFLTRKDVYDEDKLHADEEALRQFYYNRGYADFRVVSSNAQLDGATNSYRLAFTLEEGPRYTFGDIAVESTVPGITSDDISRVITTQTGAVYSANMIKRSIEAISDRVASAGYPFARVTPRGERDLGNNTIRVRYLVDQGERAYIERIEIRGNNRTRDYIIRREFDMSEGDPFNQQMLTKAKRRLEALGYFSSVEIGTASGSAPDRVIVTVDVKEESTGSFGIGAGVGSEDGLVLEASVEEKNFLGRGQYIRLAASGGLDDSDRNYSLSFTEPYFLGYRLAAGLDVNYSDSSYDDYDYSETGVTLRLTAPITEDLASTFRYNFRQMDYDGDADDLSATYANLTENGPWVRSSISNTLTYNTLDDSKLPRSGIYATLTQELAGLGGDSKFYKISGKVRYYQLLLDDADVIGSFSAGAGHVAAFGDSLNVFDQFMIGGNEIRGFATKGIGPRIANTDDQPLGGTTYFTVSAEATFPMPGIPRDFNLRGAVFADAGTLFGNQVDVLGSDVAESTDASLRASVGFGFIWDSPFGALRFDYAVPIAYEDSDELQRFKVGINNQF